MLVKLAEELGLDRGEAEKAVADQEFAERIEKDMDGEVRSGVHGTPSFFISGVRHEGAFGVQDLVAAIEGA